MMEVESRIDKVFEFDEPRKPKDFLVVAGPCAFESIYDQKWFAMQLKMAGADVYRTFFWKGQLHPEINGKPEYKGEGYGGQLQVDEVLEQGAEINNFIKCVSEVMTLDHALALWGKGYEYIQIGARHMGNLHLLREIGKYWEGKVILKRNFGATLDEWIGAAEHLEYYGVVDEVILCERGIVTFNRTPESRWTLDLQTALQAKLEHDYRVIIDPSHGTGRADMVPYFIKAAYAMGFNGVEVEVHPSPKNSPTDAAQAIDLETFRRIMNEIGKEWKK